MIAIAGGVILLCSSASAGFMMMGASDEDDTKKTEDETTETTPTPTPTPTPTDSWDQIEQVKGHPIGKSGVHHVAAGGTWHLVGPGDAPSAEDCWKFSKSNGINNWGWRKDDKSCWAYMDPILGAGEGQVHPNNHLSGCTKAGRKYTSGCEDFSKGDIVWGHHHQTQGPPNTGHHDKMTLEQCRQRMKEEGKEVFGYRTNLHPDNSWTTTCFTYVDGNSVKGWFGNGADKAHVTGCTDPTKMVRNGCK